MPQKTRPHWGGLAVSAMHRLLIAEDHHLLRCGLRSMLSALGEYEVVGEAKDGREACQLAISLVPDLVLTDLSMPGMNGIDMVATIKRRLPQVRVVVLTVYKAEEYVREALRVGVDGYVLKDASFDELVAALHPTPAVGGTPREAALEALPGLESSERGLYAGALGWFNHLNDGELVVGIRSALIKGKSAKLYSGAGVVAGSTAEGEIRETDMKLRALYEALVPKG